MQSWSYGDLYARRVAQALASEQVAKPRSLRRATARAIFAIVLITLALAMIITTATAQQRGMPTTVPLLNKNKERIGTATFFGPRITLRDNQGEVFATLELERDGTRTMYDAHGKVLDRIPAR